MIKYSKFTLFFILLFVISCSSSKQTTNKNIPSFDKWEKAVLNIESVSDKYNIQEILNYIKDRKNQNKIYSELDSINDYNELRLQNNKVSGTAIYLSEGENRYLSLIHI